MQPEVLTAHGLAGTEADMGAAVPVSAERLTWVLSSLERLVAEQSTNGQQLVQVLIDQLADGQVETLHSLHSAAAAVRRHSSELESAAELPAREIRSLITGLQVAAVTLGQTATAATRQVADVLTDDVGARLLEIEQVLTREVVDTAKSATDLLSKQLSTEADGIGQRLADSTAADTTRLEVMGTHFAATLEHAADQLGDRVADTGAAIDRQSAVARALLEEQLIRVQVALAAAGVSAAEGIREAGAMAASQVAAAGALAASQVEAAGAGALARLVAGVDHLDERASAIERQVTSNQAMLKSHLTKTVTAIRATGGFVVGDVQTAGLEVGVELAARLDRITQELTAGMVSAARDAGASFDAGAARSQRHLRRAHNGLIRAALAATEGLERAEHDLTVTLEDRTSQLSAQAEQYLTKLEELSQDQQRLGVRSDARVQRLIERSDRAVALATDQLQVQADRLAARDLELEGLRAKEFALVLDDVLNRAGLKGRDLRDRMARVLQADRRERSPAAPPPDEVPNAGLALESEPESQSKPDPRTPPVRPVRRRKPAPKQQEDMT